MGDGWMLTGSFSHERVGERMKERKKERKKPDKHNQWLHTYVRLWVNTVTLPQ